MLNCGRSTSGGAPWPDLQEGSVCDQLHRRQRDLQALSIPNGISWDILLKMSLSSEIRENVLLKNILLVIVSQGNAGLKVKGNMCLLCLVSIRKLELGSPTSLTTFQSSSGFNHFVGIFRNLSCESQYVFPSMLLPSLNSKADAQHGLTGEKQVPAAAFL